MSHRSRLGTLVIDCQGGDLAEAARFWGAALGSPVRLDTGDPRYAAIERPADEPKLLVQRVEHGVQIVDPLRERARRNSFREPHPELVDGHHPPARRCLRDEPPPQVRPRRVAVDAHQRPVQRRPVVEHVPRVPAGIGDQP